MRSMLIWAKPDFAGPVCKPRSISGDLCARPLMLKISSSEVLDTEAEAGNANLLDRLKLGLLEGCPGSHSKVTSLAAFPGPLFR